MQIIIFLKSIMPCFYKFEIYKARFFLKAYQLLTFFHITVVPDIKSKINKAGSR